VKKLLIVSLVLLPVALFAASSTVTIDYTTNMHFYQRDLAVGVNFLGEWVDYANYHNNLYRFQQGGFRFLRFPGGSNSNEYHWNGNGAYDANKIWNNTGSPNVTAFSRGFYNEAIHRGSLSAGYGKWAKVTDGDLATSWLSYPDDDNIQWIYIDIEGPGYTPVAVNRITIDWGDPYATQFKVQYSNGNWNGEGQWAYNDTAWTDTSLGVLSAAAGGHSDLSFTQVNAKYVRVFCPVSSGTHNQFEIKEIKLYNGTTQLTKNEADVSQSPSVSSSVALGDNFITYDTMDFEEYMSLVHSMTPPAEPMITINFYTGTTQEAADWVYYANIFKGYNVKYWEIGNENWGNWEAGGPSNSTSYAKRFLALYDAMIAVDPTIAIVPQFNYITDPENVTMTAGNNDHNPGNFQYYIDDFLQYLQNHGRTGILKGISIHRYPSYEPTAEATPLAMTDQWNTDLPLLKGWVNNRTTNAGEVKTWLTEYNDGIDSGFTDHFYDSLFISAFFLNYLRNGGDMSCFFVTFGTPGPGQNDKTIFSDFGMLEGGGLGGSLADKKYQPRASFYAFDMIYNNFSAADIFGNTLVSAVSTNNALKVYANKRGDRKLSLIFVNTDQSNTIDASVTLNGFTPLPSAELVSYSRQDYSWVLNGTQSYAAIDNPPEVSTYNSASGAFTYSVEPYSIKIITMYDQSQPTLVPSDTPTQLPTSTITPTPIPNGGAMIDDCEDGDLTNFWGGEWSIYGDNKSSYPAALTGMTCDGLSGNGSNCYMKVTGTVLLNTFGFGINCPLNPSWTGTDISMYDGIAFYYKGEGGTARMGFPQTDQANGNYGFDVTGTTTWKYYQVPFSSFTLASWSAGYVTWTAKNIQAMQIQPNGGYGGAGYREIDIDDVMLYKNTPTRTVTKTPFVTSTLTPVVTATMTPFITFTATPTITRTPAVAANLGKVKAYPAPCNFTSGCREVIFEGLTERVNIRVFDMSGRLVFETEQDAPDGTYSWNIDPGRRESRIAPGLYLYIISNDKKETARGKVAIIR
jgi:hypothetical protein